LCYFVVIVLQSLPETITAADTDGDEMRPFNDHPNFIIKGKQKFFAVDAWVHPIKKLYRAVC